MGARRRIGDRDRVRTRAGAADLVAALEPMVKVMDGEHADPDERDRLLTQQPPPVREAYETDWPPPTPPTGPRWPDRPTARAAPPG